ncbi:MAG: DsbA family protein [Rhodospirillaceae bacterium]|jgi:putative protein-disulfide isomerase|nr:DsbA family protein [Rhodospirillaceae bacterium]MBT5938394.1 DsbA family protein [Rhodospirillaceae bacterium]MBT7265818.1 DsbA family protein [Rhodospirillaceae bacterium]
MTNEILYFGDPMCSWCWGFAPVLNAIHDDFGEQAPLSIIVGGLHAYDDFPMGDDYKADIRHHWEDVNKATGAVFDYRFFDREGFVLDTEPACRAVVTARQMNPGVLLPFYESISRSFYSENKDTTDVLTFKPLAEEVGLDFEEFADKFASDELKEVARSDFQFSQQIGVTGFPTVVVKEDDKMALLSAGYQPYQNLKPAIEDWLANGLQELPEEE